MAETFTLPHQVPRTGARLTYELEDVQSSLPANGNQLVFDAAKKLWVPRALVLADLPPIALDNLSDVTITAGATGEVLRHNGTAWVDDRVALDDLSDVVITTPAVSQHLRHNGTNWVNLAPLLDDSSDVTLTSPAAQHILFFNGSVWVNTLSPYLGCTSSTRPASPGEGQAIYETDTDRFLIWNGAAWRMPWNMPWGTVFYGENTGGGTQTSTFAFDISGLTTGSVTPVANRLWMLSCFVPWVKVTGTGQVTVSINDGTGTHLVGSVESNVAVGVFRTQSVGPKVLTTTASAVTYKVVIDPNATGVTLNVSGTQPATFLVEDIGPNGAPA